MTEYKVPIGYDSEKFRGFLGIQPQPDPEVVSQLMRAFDNPKDRHRTFILNWPDGNLEVMVSPVIPEELYLLRGFMTRLLEERNHQVDAAPTIADVAAGEPLFDN